MDEVLLLQLLPALQASIEKAGGQFQFPHGIKFVPLDRWQTFYVLLQERLAGRHMGRLTNEWRVWEEESENTLPLSVARPLEGPLHIEKIGANTAPSRSSQSMVLRPHRAEINGTFVIEIDIT